MAISKTAALFNRSRLDGASKSAIKVARIDEVPSSTGAAAFPKAKMLTWLEHEKVEHEHYGVINWRATYNLDVPTSFRAHVTSGRFVFAP